MTNRQRLLGIAALSFLAVMSWVSAGMILIWADVDPGGADPIRWPLTVAAISTPALFAALLTDLVFPSKDPPS